MNDLPNFTEQGYKIIRQLGYNAQGGRITYLGLNLQSQQKVVIKEFRFALIDSNWAGYQAHEREIEILEKLSHSRIPRYLHSFPTDNGFCLVQEYKPAPSLAEKLAEKKYFSPEEVKKIALSVLDLLVYLQKFPEPIFHRDIKPENILVDDKLNAYLIDFGLARIGTGTMALSTVTAGTLSFMPYEQINNKKLTRASDLYSLGITLICLLTKTSSTEIKGLITAKGVNFKNKVPPLHSDFIKWLEKMVQPEINDRFSDAKSALNQLKSIPVQGLTLSEKLGIAFQNSRELIEENSKRLAYTVVKNSVGLIGKHKGLLFFLLLGIIGIRFVAPKIEQKISEIQQERLEKQEKAERERLAPVRNATAQNMILTRKCIECDMQYVDLEDADLDGVNLQKSNLKGADLSSADLPNANLIGADLSFADLSWADLPNANLKAVNLEGADLLVAELQNANLIGANLQGAYLLGANLQGVNLGGAYLQGADLQRADLRGANLQEVNIFEAKSVKNANFSGAIMTGGIKYEEWVKLQSQ